MEKFNVIFGGLAILIGIALVFAKTDKEKLSNSSHPGLALFRFESYRWGVAVILVLFGCASIFGWFEH